MLRSRQEEEKYEEGEEVGEWLSTDDDVVEEKYTMWLGTKLDHTVNVECGIAGFLVRNGVMWRGTSLSVWWAKDLGDKRATKRG